MKQDTACSYCDSLNGGHTMACQARHEGKPKPEQVQVAVTHSTKKVSLEEQMMEAQEILQDLEKDKLKGLIGLLEDHKVFFGGSLGEYELAFCVGEGLWNLLKSGERQ